MHEPTAFANFMARLVNPVTNLAILATILAGIWLAFLHEWIAILIGFVVFFGSGHFMGLAIIPSAMLLANPAARCIEAGKRKTSIVLAFCSRLYVVTLMTAWCMTALYFFKQLSQPGSVMPMIIWSLSVAMSPWIWLARKDRQCGILSSSRALFVAGLAYMVAAIMMIFTRLSMLSVIVTFAAIMIVFMYIDFLFVLQAALAENDGTGEEHKKGI